MTDSDSSKQSTTDQSVLVVDDNDLVRNLLIRVLEDAGHRVFSAASGPEALELFRARAGDIGCVLQDLIMPGMSGAEVIAELKILDPSVRVIVLSADDEAHVRAQLCDQEIAGFLRKPFQLAHLVELVRAVLAGD